MTMLAAVGMAFGLFADDATLTGQKSFASETLTDDYSANITLANGWGEYTGTAGTLKITGTEGEDDHVLQMKTGGAALKRNVLSTGDAYAVDGNVYFDTMIDLNGEALTEFPTVDDDAKLAIFAYDNTDDLEGTQTTPWTAFYALAKDGNGTTMLYQIYTGVDITSGQHRITVQAYENIMKSGSTENIGFKIFIDGGEIEGMTDPASIEAAYAFDNDGKVIWTNVFNQNNYLKGLVQPQFASTAVRKTLFVGLLSSVDGQYLTSMDFQGNAKMANIEINDTGFPFIAPDIQVMTLVKNNVTVTAEPAAALEGDNIVEDCTLTITPDTGKTIITYNYNSEEPTVLDGNTLDVTFTPNATLTITAVAPAATVTVDDETYQVATLDEAIEAVNGAETLGKLVLAQPVVLKAGEQISFSGANVVLDLNGKTIKGVGDGDNETVIYNEGKLTIIDGSDEKTGSVVSSAAGDGAIVVQNGEEATLAIEAGTFVGAIADANEPVATTLKGGKYTQADNEQTTLAGFLPAQGYQVVEDGAYWKVVEVTSVDFTVTAGANSIIAEVLVNDVDVTASRPAKLNAGDTYKVTFAANSGYMFAAGETGIREGTAADAAIAVTGPDAALIVATVTDADDEPMGDYATLAAALTAATNGCTVTLQQNATLGKTSLSKSITLDLNNKTLTGAVGASDKYLISINLGYELTVKNGSIVAKTDATQAAFSEIFHVYADLTVENVAIDATGLTGTGYFGDGTAAVFAVMNGNVQITGSTSVANVNKGYLLSVGNHAGAGKGYDSRNVTINTTGTLDGDFFFAGGKVTYTAGDITGAKFYYGAARADTDDTKVDATTVFAISDLTGFTLTTGVGEVPTAPAEEAKYLVNGQLYATVADAEAVAQDKIVLFTDYELTVDKEFNNAVAVVAPAKITLGEFALTTKNQLVIADVFTDENVKESGEGPYTYKVESAPAPTPIDPTKPEKDFPTQKDAQDRADQLNANGKALITVPADFTGSEATYRGVVAAKAVDAGDGTYSVIVDIDPNVVENAQATADNGAAAAITDLTATKATITAIPGLYYSVVAGKTLKTMEEGDRVPAKGETVELTLPRGETAEFYQIKVNAAPKAAE